MPHEMKFKWNITLVHQNDVVLPSSDICLRKLIQLEFYFTNDVERIIPRNAGSWPGVLDRRLDKQWANFAWLKMLKSKGLWVMLNANMLSGRLD